MKLKKKNLKMKPGFVRRQASVCPNDMFQCAYGECILLEWTFDNQFDCHYGSDEQDCRKKSIRVAAMLKVVLVVFLVLSITEAVKLKKQKNQERKRHVVEKRQDDATCGEGNFQCTSGDCIPRDWTCDTQFDCYDGSDERDCQCECLGEHQFKCRNGPCIPATHICDAEDDCGDNSDESDCHLVTCGSDQVQCDNYKCIPDSWICDGDNDCGTGFDESDCGNTCNSYQFQCTDHSRCIPSTWKCDGGADCADGSDEEDCSCDNSTQFTCRNGQCIPISWQCDGDNDCGDLSDETGCPTLHPSVCNDMMPMRDCALMNETATPICEHDELGFKYCRKFCDLCLSEL